MTLRAILDGCQLRVAMMDAPYIELCHLQRSFKEGAKTLSVLRDASLTINRGETIALLGRSGCGKSTLLNVISGIDKPDVGSVTINGVELTSLSERQSTLYRRQHIGFIYQFFNLIPTLTAAENIAVVLELNRYAPPQVTSLTQQILATVGLAQRCDSYPDQLSGGEQQRVAIARALVHKPSLVLADEPTGNLDAESGSHVLDLLHQLAKQQQSSLIIVTHSMAVAKMADRILTMEDGKLAEREGSFLW